ncbi:hypothetical protein ACWD04_10310 [Streptomyces sp. NPDC002911]
MRDATARIVISILTAILLAVQFPVPAAPSSSAYSAQESPAGSPETHSVGLPGQDVTPAWQEYTPCGPPSQEREPNGLLHTRDRHRAVVQSVPETLSRCLVTGDTSVRPPTAALIAAADPHRTPSASLSPAVLQVFRC